MNNQQIADNYAQGATKGKGSNMFIDKQAVYSYGYHYPIAVKLSSGHYLFNMNSSYSSSTARHCSHVRSALEGYKLTLATSQLMNEYIDGDISQSILDKNIATLRARREVIMGKGERARSDHMRSIYLEQSRLLSESIASLLVINQ